MQALKSHQTEIWAQLAVCRQDCERIRDFITSEFRVPKSRVVRRLHLTVYHSRRPMPGVLSLSEEADLVLPSCDTRFMVLAPGGENARPELDPGSLRVGIRVHKQ